LRDGGTPYRGKGVTRAVNNVRQVLAPAVMGLDANAQSHLDATLRELDGTADLGRLGANAVLAVSVASAVAAAAGNGVPLYRWLAGGERPLLPMPMVNVISGGAHASGTIDIQDFLVVPLGASSFAQAIAWAWDVRQATADIASERGLSVGLVADEGGLGLSLASNREALELLTAGLLRSGHLPGTEVAIAIDVAATQLLVGGNYRLAIENRVLDSNGLLRELESWCDSYPIVSIEDPLAEDDWSGWSEATRRLGNRIQLLGDDLFVTDLGRLQRGITQRVANAVLAKPNQTGTLSGAAEVVVRARDAGYATVVSARSGDTEDSWLADLAVGWRAGQIKVGSLTRSERTAKWNRLLAIENELGSAASFAGREYLAPTGVRLRR
jgi:enolase